VTFAAKYYGKQRDDGRGGKGCLRRRGARFQVKGGQKRRSMSKSEEKEERKFYEEAVSIDPRWKVWSFKKRDRVVKKATKKIAKSAGEAGKTKMT